MIFAHLPASYILLKSSHLLGFSTSLPESFSVLMAGVILDFDLLIGQFFKKSHHDLPTHTPLGVLVIWLAFIFFLGNKFSLAGKTLILFSLWLHLFLDELNHWVYFWKTKKTGWFFEINWLYPLTKFKNRPAPQGLAPFLYDYFRKEKLNVLLELIICAAAFVLFIK